MLRWNSANSTLCLSLQRTHLFCGEMAAGPRCGLLSRVRVSVTGFDHCTRNTDLNHRKGEGLNPLSPLPWAWPELNLSSDSNETFLCVFATLYFLVFQKAVRAIYCRVAPFWPISQDHKAFIKSDQCHRSFPLCLVSVATLAISAFISHWFLNLWLIFHLCSIPLD